MMSNLSPGTTRERTWLTGWLGPLERLIYRICRVRANQEMPRPTDVFAMLGLSATGITALYAMLRTQQLLPLNPQGFGNSPPELAWNAAIRFVAVVLIVGALTFFPADALGPIVEHVMLRSGRTF